LPESITLQDLPFQARIGTSCLRREVAVKSLRPDFLCVDIRGTIERRLQLLDAGELEGVVMAEAALIRLGLTQRNRVKLSGSAAALQGQLAVVARSSDCKMASFFSPIDWRKKA
jgi:porphobilinogen deaminase